MKCREMNPGNQPDKMVDRGVGLPSMKCREMNPGNHPTSIGSHRRGASLNEVPGDESRQSRDVEALALEQRPSMKCREMNPGNHGVESYRLPFNDPSMKCREMNPGNREYRDGVTGTVGPPQ